MCDTSNDEGFERVGLARNIRRYQPDNVASVRTMETLGMTFERDAVGRHGDTVRISPSAAIEG